jgi:hypothetical protein
VIKLISDTLARWAHDTIHVVSFTGFDEFANPTFGAESTHTVRIAHTERIVRNRNGALVTSPTQIYFVGDPGIVVEDKITLPDGNVPLIQSIQKNTDFDGAICYTEVLV